MSDVLAFFQSDKVRNRFSEVLGEKAQSFLLSVNQIITSNSKLQSASIESLYSAAVTAALLDLPFNSSLGYAYIVPRKGEAQFQIGYKGLIQLAHRTGQFTRIHASDVKEGELVSQDRLTGDITFNWLDNETRTGLKTIGYVSYFRLVNGFESTLYMTAAEMDKHAKTYSDSYRIEKGEWVDNYDRMALKTVLKLNLLRNAPLSPQLTMAIERDQAVIKDDKVIYVDNTKTSNSVESAINAIASIIDGTNSE